MSDSAAPTEVSTGAQVAASAQDDSLREVAQDAAVGKGKGKARADESADLEEDEDDDDDEDDSDDDEDEEDDDDDLDIEPDEVDPQNIESYGIGNRPSRSRKNIDYSSEEALKKAGFSAGQGDEEEEDRDFKADVSMDG